MSAAPDTLANAPSEAPALDGEAVRADFPNLSEEVHGKRLVYLDSGASAHKPRVVLEAMERFYTRDYSNVHRGVHVLSQRATAAFEAARATMARFLGAPDERGVIFTRGTTEGINLVAQSWGRANLGPGDEVVISEMEHHSGIVPWQLACEATGARLVVLRMDERGVLPEAEITSKIGPKTRIVSVTHISNALGTVNPVARIVAQAHAHGALVLVDGAQAAPHLPIDVAALGCDFYVVSGHKMYGPTGIGVLWGRYEVLAAMPPWHGGGDMIKRVTFEETTYAEPPARFEAGTPHIAGAIGMAAAADYLMALGLERVEAWDRELLAYGHAVLAEIPGLRIIGNAPEKAGILSFVIDGVHPHDLGTLLDMDGVAVRVGHHCAQPVMDRFGVSATTRASLGVYNTREDLDRLASAIKKALSLLL
ncbi:MAG: SufS family cysteine desulfurase [Deltaproteobacteria bacterium]|nr:MAG: SufS family cysteine desulfurase [Deltaproteobacteria bacterium]